jgi:AAA15 family ATPase/GTPase
MLLEFSIENFRSIAQMQTLSLVAAKLKSKNEALAENNLVTIEDEFRLVRSAGIYGANGSGKSNFIRGLMTMIYIIRESMRDDQILRRFIDPFQLNPLNREQPTYFQIQFVLEGKKYRYGFEANQTRIESEWLFGPANKNETMYFSRIGQNIRLNKKYFKEGEGLEMKTSETNLFLNVVNAFNGTVSREIRKFFDHRTVVFLGINDHKIRRFTLQNLESEAGKHQILQMLNLADSGIETIYQERDDYGDPIWSTTVLTTRKVFDSDNHRLEDHKFVLDSHESEGTKKLFDLSGVLLDTLRQGNLLAIDEFDARFHPLLSRKIVELFNNPTTNPKGAQLVFVTHDTNLLDKDLLRRDQIYFVEKDLKGQSSLYSLFDFKGVRNDAAIEKNYIQGKYGAIPFLGDFNQLFNVE